MEITVAGEAFRVGTAGTVLMLHVHDKNLLSWVNTHNATPGRFGALALARVL